MRPHKLSAGRRVPITDQLFALSRATTRARQARKPLHCWIHYRLHLTSYPAHCFGRPYSGAVYLYCCTVCFSAALPHVQTWGAAPPRGTSLNYNLAYLIYADLESYTAQLVERDI